MKTLNHWLGSDEAKYLRLVAEAMTAARPKPEKVKAAHRNKAAGNIATTSGISRAAALVPNHPDSFPNRFKTSPI